MIHDFTPQFSSPPLVWSDSVQRVGEQLPAQVHQIERGLYVTLFENANNAAVYDKNGGELVVVEPHGVSLKPGKFENGLIGKAHEDARHLHRYPNEPFGQTWAECMRFHFVLDLTGVVKDGSQHRAAKQFLKEQIDARITPFLARDIDRARDWRYLIAKAPLPLQELRDVVKAALEDTKAHLKL